MARRSPPLPGVETSPTVRLTDASEPPGPGPEPGKALPERDASLHDPPEESDATAAIDPGPRDDDV